MTDPADIVPPNWRALGYVPFGDLVAGLQMDGEKPPVIRKLWASRQLPPPDVTILTGTTRTPLPGWSQETIVGWLLSNPQLRRRQLALREHWITPAHDVDPRVVTLARDVLATGQRISGTSEPVLGYDAAARYITSLGLLNEKGKPISMSGGYLRLVWRYDLNRGYQAVAPVPNAIISRGPQRIQLPGWTEQTLREWPNQRQTPGNWTYGDQRAVRKPKDPATR